MKIKVKNLYGKYLREIICPNCNGQADRASLSKTDIKKQYYRAFICKTCGAKIIETSHTLAYDDLPYSQYK